MNLHSILKTLLNIDNYIFNISSILEISLAGIALIFSIWIFTKTIQKEKEDFSYTFLGLWLAVVLLYLGLGMCMASSNATLALLWDILFARLGAIFVPVFYYLCSLSIRNKYTNTKALVFLLGGVSVWIMSISLPGWLEEIKLHFFGYFPVYGWMGKLFIGVFSIFIFLSFKNFFLEYKEAKTFEKKQRLKYIICGFLIGLGGAVDFLPIIKLPVYPLGAFFAFGALIIFAYTLLKHEILLREWKYKYLLDCMDTFYAMLDREGRIIYLNKRYSGLGYDLKDIYGEYFWDADWFPKEKKDYLKIKEEIQKVIKGEKSSFETVLIDKDNNFYEVLLTLAPLKDAKSQIVGVVCEAKNIKEFKKIQAHFKLLIDESKDAIISCDDQMKVIIWNKAAQELLGYTPEEMIGKSLLQIVPSQYHQKKIEGFKKFSQTGE